MTNSTTTQFAGNTTHSNVKLSDQSATVAGFDPDDGDDIPDASLSTIVNGLPPADSGRVAWELPDKVAGATDVAALNDALPEGSEAVRADRDTVFIRTDRHQSIYNPDSVREMVGLASDDEIGDALWNIPTNDYEVIEPSTAYQPLLEAVRDEGHGDAVFGEVTTRREGGEVLIDILFDAFQIDYDGGDPIVLGIRTGYDYFGSTALFFEGFAQDTRCENSIREITDRRVVRHFGDSDIESTIEDVLSEIGLMRDQLANLLKLAEDVTVDLIENDFAEPFDHDDDLRAWYELAGFPSYLAQSAAAHALSRADDQFEPDFTELWDGATYALTHSFTGAESSATMREYNQIANDMVMNPAGVLSSVTEDHERRLREQQDDDTDQMPSATATIINNADSIEQKKKLFEKRNERLQQTIAQSQ